MLRKRGSSHILAALLSDSGYGHKFVDIYMKPNYELLPAINALADSNLQALQSPTPRRVSSSRIDRLVLQLPCNARKTGVSTTRK